MREGTTAAARETAKKNEEMSHEKLWYRFRQQALETDSCHEEKKSTQRELSSFSSLLSNILHSSSLWIFHLPLRSQFWVCSTTNKCRSHWDSHVHALPSRSNQIRSLLVRHSSWISQYGAPCRVDDRLRKLPPANKRIFCLKLKFYWCRISISEGCSIEIILWDNCWVGMWWLCKMSDLLRGLEGFFEDFFY